MERAKSPRSGVVIAALLPPTLGRIVVSTFSLHDALRENDERSLAYTGVLPPPKSGDCDRSNSALLFLTAFKELEKDEEINTTLLAIQAIVTKARRPS